MPFDDVNVPRLTNESDSLIVPEFSKLADTPTVICVLETVPALLNVAVLDTFSQSPLKEATLVNEVVPFSAEKLLLTLPWNVAVTPTAEPLTTTVPIMSFVPSLYGLLNGGIADLLNQSEPTSVWFFSGILLIIMGMYVTEPYFSSPTDTLSNSISLILVLTCQ